MIHKNIKFYKYNRATAAVLQESCRLRNEFQTDNEYQEYLEDFNARMRKALNKFKYKNYWLNYEKF